MIQALDEQAEAEDSEDSPNEDDYLVQTSPDDDAGRNVESDQGSDPDLFADHVEQDENVMDDDAGSEEERVAEEPLVQRRRNPVDPTPEEKERHMTAGHLPYRPWCKI